MISLQTQEYVFKLYTICADILNWRCADIPGITEGFQRRPSYDEYNAKQIDASSPLPRLLHKHALHLMLDRYLFNFIF
jgi:hypothetical protein